MVECGLPAIEHMTYSENQALPGSMVTISCDQGYILIGEASVNCNDEGKFNQSLSSCKCKHTNSECCLFIKKFKVCWMVIFLSCK